jgi:hypothetical protein
MCGSARGHQLASTEVVEFWVWAGVAIGVCG